MLSSPKTRRARRGFSVIEFAIVMGIIGIVLAAIWQYASQAFETARRERLGEELFAIANNVHSLYLGQGAICGTFDQLTARLAVQNAVPSTMVRSDGCTNAGPPANICLDTPWSGTATVSNGSLAIGAGSYATAKAGSSSIGTPCAAGNNPQQQFTIELRNLSMATCIGVVPLYSSSASAPGLQDVVINGIDIMTAGGTIVPVLPVRVEDAEGLCTDASKVDFVYRLQARNF